MAKRTPPPADGPRARKPRQKKDKPAEFFRGARLMVADDEADAEFTEITDTQRRLYLRAIATMGPRYGAAARAAGVCAKTGFNWRADLTDVVFQRALEQAIRLGVERMESELIRRGFHGIEKPIYQGGRMVGTVREYDTTAAIFMLKGVMPEKYRERHEHSGPQGSALPAPVTNVLVSADLTLAEVKERLQRAAEVLRLASAPIEGEVVPAVPAPAAESPEQAYARELAARQANGRNGGGDGH